MFGMRFLKITLPLTIALLAAPTLASAQQATGDDSRELNLRAYGELLRSDIRAQKVAVITEVMQFTEAEDQKFWPIYREYEAELAKLNDDRMALIKDYAMNYDNLTDASADKLALGALDLESRRNALKAKYYDRFKSALQAKTAARFLQVENQILLLLDLQIAASLPVASR
jgi:hypothetical protein